MQLAQEIGLKPRDVENLYGIEFEAEGCGEWIRDPARVNHNFTYLSVHDDGSLRNSGYEFITSPCTYPQLVLAAKEFADLALKYGFVHSTRTSTHIHINMLDMELPKIGMFVAGMLAIEPLLLGICTPDRRYNFFCQPLSCTPAAISFVSEISRGARKGMFDPRRPSVGKYTAVSTHRLYEFGTIEYRCLHGSNDTSRVLLLARAMGALKEFCRAAEPDNLADILIRPAAEVYEVLLGHEIVQELTAAALVPEDMPSAAEYCCDLARVSLLELKAAVVDAPAVGTDFKIIHAPPEADGARVAVPTLPPALYTVLREIPVGVERFGFLRESEFQYTHTFVLENGVLAQGRYTLPAPRVAQEVIKFELCEV